MRNHFALVAATLLASAASAQFTHVLPNGLATSEGNTSNAFPWGRGSAASLQIQTIYDSSNFTAASIAGPILITRLRYRLNGGVTNGTNATYTQATVDMASAAVDALSPSTSFNANMGPDRAQVFAGPVAITAQAAATPGTFGFADIVLTTPFLYDPSSGNDLVIFSDIPPGVGVGVPSLQMDVQGAGSLSSRVYNSTAYGSGTGTIDLNHGVVVEITYVPPTGFATKRPFGGGCIRTAGTAHEFFATAATFDLSGTSMSLLPAGANGYVALPGISAYIPPTAAAQTLALTDDSETTVPLASAMPIPGGTMTALTVCSNGYVSAATGNGTGFTPSSATFLGFPQTCWATWHDFNPAAGGAVKYEQAGNLSIVTWDGVVDFGGTTTNTFQYQFERATGTVHLVWQAVAGAGNAYLVGFKCGGGVLAAPSMDISAALPNTFTLGCDARPLALDASARPVLGTSFNLVTTEVPATALVTVSRLTFLALPSPFDLTPLGAPGCFAHVDVVGPDNAILLGSPSVTRPLVLPNLPGLAGTAVYSQSATLVPGINTLGLLTSNGLELRVGVN